MSNLIGLVLYGIQAAWSFLVDVQNGIGFPFVFVLIGFLLLRLILWAIGMSNGGTEKDGK